MASFWRAVLKGARDSVMWPSESWRVGVESVELGWVVERYWRVNSCFREDGGWVRMSWNV